LTEPVTRTLEDGGGIPADAYRRDYARAFDQVTRRVYDSWLLDGYVPTVPGWHERLDEGCRLVELGCGSGHLINLLAATYRNSTFTGFDLTADAIDRGRREAAKLALENVAFEMVDTLQLDVDPAVDVIVAVDVINQQHNPAAVLKRALQALKPGGILVMLEVNLSSNLEDNLDHPYAPWFYAISLFHCLQVSLHDGGAGLGSCWGYQNASAMLEHAGFSQVSVHAPACDPLTVIVVGRR
jgi:SAM-dependent methyltransferase